MKNLIVIALMMMIPALCHASGYEYSPSSITATVEGVSVSSKFTEIASSTAGGLE